MKIKFCAFVLMILGLLGSELHAGNLKVNLAPSPAVAAGAQWRVDGGSWRNSGSTATSLSNGTHVVSYKAVSGWITPANASVTLSGGATTTITGTYVSPASLKINLTPTTGRWRVDGGSWQNNGATVSGLTPGSHSVDYQDVSGFNSPAAESVTLTAGQTTTLTRAYVQLARLTVNLNPNSGQWRLDGGAWRNSGTTATGLAPGAHNLEFASVGGFSSPPAESVSLAAGQSLTLTRTYTAQSKLRITLAPTTGQWRIDGGTWRASGTLVSNLTAGNHTVDYKALPGYNAPATETVSLVPGQTTTLTRAYVQLAQLTVSLTPATTHWRVDGGVWLASGAVAGDLSPGDHTVDYQALDGFMAPSSETISLSPGQTTTLARAYTQLAQLTITLTPATGQWRADEGPWQASGATLSLPPGDRFIEYSELPDYDSPTAENISLAPGDSVSASRAYTTQKPTLRVTLITPVGVPWQVQWRIDGGAWLNSGVTAADLTAGAHTLDYTNISGPFLPLPSETITLAPRENANLLRVYTLKPPAALTITLTPTATQWRVNGGAWQASGATLGNLPYDTPLSIQYGSLPGYTAPPSESVTLASGQSLSLARSYTRLPQISITLTPGSGQWRVNAGAWQASGATVGNLPYDTPVSIQYAPLPGYTEPPSELVTLANGQTLSLARSYTPLPRISITLTPASGEYIGQWRVDGGAWQASGATIVGLTPGAHTISYLALPFYSFYANLPDETVNLAVGQSLTLSRNYPKLAAIYVILNPTSAQWRIDGGAWTASGISNPIFGLSVGAHLIEYSAVPGYITPPAETITLAAGGNPPITRTYTQLATFGVNLTPESAQWRIDGGPWNASRAFFIDLALGTHTIEYSTVPGYITPPAESVTLVSGINQPLVRSYTLLATFGVNLTPASAQWRFVGAGVWNASGAFFTNVPLGVNVIEYAPVPGYVTPPNDSVTLVSGINQPLVRNYLQLASVHVTTTPATTQWRIDGGTWWPSGSTTVNNLAFGVPHTVEFLDFPGYVTPPAQTFTLAASELREVTATFQKLASVHVTATPGTGQWRIDGSTWWPSGSTTVNNLAFGVPHTVEFSDLPTYITPPAQTFTLLPGEQREVTVTYGQITSLSITLNLPSAQWRIDGGAWRSSGATVANLTAGSHIVEYNNVSGYTAPFTETIVLTAGQTLSLSRSYISTTTQLTVTLTPASGQWRLATGTAWLASGTTIDITPGEQIIYYLPLAGYNGPLNDTLTVTRGQSVALTRNYTLLTAPPKYTAALIPSLNGNWSSGNAINNSSAMTGSLYLGGGILHACRYSGGVMQDLETLGGTFSFGNGINSAGTIAGQARTAGGATHAVVISGDAMQDLGTLGGTDSAAYDINDAGVIVGASTLATGKYHAFRYDAGNWVDLGTLGGDRSYAFGINQTGAIVGRADNAAGASHAFVLTGGAMQDLGTLGGSASTALDINDAGIVVGEANTPAGTPHAFVFSGGTLQDLGTIAGHASSSAMAINNTGTVVGWTYTNQQIDLRPFVYVDGVMTDLNTLVNLPGVLLTYANDINDQGQILVHGTDFVSQLDFILTPVAAPSASLQVYLNPVAAQWRIDGGAWNASGASVQNLSTGAHGIEYQAVADHISPPAESVTLVAGANPALYTDYISIDPAQLTVTTTPGTGRWRIYPSSWPAGGAWLASGATATGLNPGTYTIEFEPVAGYVTPATTTITLAADQVKADAFSYTPQ